MRRQPVPRLPLSSSAVFSSVSKSRPGALARLPHITRSVSLFVRDLLHFSHCIQAKPLDVFNGGRFVIAAAAAAPPPPTPAAALAPGQMPQRAKISAQHSWMHYPAALIYRRTRALVSSFFSIISGT